MPRFKPYLWLLIALVCGGTVLGGSVQAQSRVGPTWTSAPPTYTFAPTETPFVVTAQPTLAPAVLVIVTATPALLDQSSPTLAPREVIEVGGGPALAAQIIAQMISLIIGLIVLAGVVIRTLTGLELTRRKADADRQKKTDDDAAALNTKTNAAAEELKVAAETVRVETQRQTNLQTDALTKIALGVGTAQSISREAMDKSNKTHEDLAVMENENKHLRETVHTQGEQIVALQAERRDSAAANQTLINEAVAPLRQEISDLKARVIDLEKQLGVKQDRIDVLERERSDKANKET